MPVREGAPPTTRRSASERARAVRDYLVSRGIAASRLTMTAYGEERLKYDTSQATLALNRRAALIIDDGSR